MPDYRLYFKDAKGRISDRVDLAFADDQTAVAQVQEYDRPYGAELWSGARKVRDIPPKSK